ncbi:FusB/FusC family EF-G-binding protein [Neobacillus sp. PS3-34]|uniref:FusB/FusC family EF-G-binding protein n=1 Tax=Neobacillus sp. PS3-34 TaxID=3070678 RepID=UPI0027DFEB20|nr:FusB/FusC family EF-G-binding protein [Neobacillus sp. PS3-34]WML48625.1 FusB/FusC family EF-G-binding protein [Neobacillus sp. PS3-34]
MEPFIRADQYQFIKTQTQILINGHASVNDRNVLSALKSLVSDKVSNLFFTINVEQKLLIEPISEVEDHVKAEEYLAALRPFIIPFKKVTEQTVKKLFPKAKKLKLPSIDDIDLKEISYLGWNDKGTNKKYIIALRENDFIGLHGSFSPASKKGICTLCSKQGQVGLFMSETKGAAMGTFIRRGNYICQDSQKCNENLISMEKLEDFIALLKG